MPVETLASFVPRLIAQRFASHPDAPSEPTGELLTAALLQCDLSGFTTLTEGLAKRGPAGVEELSRSLSVIFEQLTSLIAAHGGDVVKFAGDALLAIWPVADGLSPQTPIPSIGVRRAAQCGLELQELMKTDPVAAEYGIAMRAGIGVGDCTALQLGGLGGRWELALVGTPLAQVGAAQTASALGKVALSPEAWLSLVCAVGDRSDVDMPSAPVALEPELVDPAPRRPLDLLTLPPEADDALWSYIPNAVRVQLVAGQADWIGELRRLTVMFVDMPALAAGPALYEAQEMVRELQRALDHYEGSFHKLSVDEQGVKLIGVFGLPPLSHEGDPVRAILAARDMRDRLTRLGVTCSIGVTTGRAFCGVLGGEARRDYTVIGDMVNLAARLMYAAQGGILCDEETYSASQIRVAFRASRPIPIKGKAEPVTAYSPTGEHIDAIATPIAMPGRSSAMVGRSAESDELANTLTALLDGHGEVIVIEGEAGIGKSRLVEHLIAEASSRGVRSLFGAGDAIETASPYRAWRPVLGQLFRLDRLPPDREVQRNHVIAALGEDEQIAQLAPLINAILPLDVPHSDLTAAMDADVRADNIRLIVTRLVQKAADDRPLLLVFDDAQWLDPSSWRLARHVFQSVHSLVAVVAARPFDQPLPSEYQAFLRTCTPRSLALGSLPPADIATLVHNTLGIEGLPDEVMDLLRDKAEGHPLFSKELAYYLRNEGVVVTAPPAEPGRLPRGRLAPDANLTEVTFPDTVQVVVTSRIDRLDARQQLMLKVASVVGRVFRANVLQDVVPVETDPARFAADLDRLEEADLIAIDTPPPDAAYMFKHAIIQEVAYSLLLFAKRRELHGAVAQWYERCTAMSWTATGPSLRIIGRWPRTSRVQSNTTALQGRQLLRVSLTRKRSPISAERCVSPTRRKTVLTRLLVPAGSFEWARRWSIGRGISRESVIWRGAWRCSTTRCHRRRQERPKVGI